MIIILLALLVGASPAWAYIDPGTSSAIYTTLGYLAAGGALVLGFILRYIKKIIAFIKRLFGYKDTAEADTSTPANPVK